jgi:hypothetical protein
LVEQRPPDAEIADWHQLPLMVFFELINDRQWGAMGEPGAIPYLAISRWAEDHGVAGDDFVALRRMVAALDDEWRDIVNSKRKPAA